MRALRMTDAGDASFEFADVPRPVAGDGEVLIEVALAGVNSADVVGPQVNITGTRPAVMRRLVTALLAESSRLHSPSG